MPDIPPYHPERILFHRIAEGDETAFRELFHQFVPLTQSIIRRVIGEESVIPDLVQDVFLKVWLSRDKLTGIQQPRSWLISVIYNECFSWLRKQKVRAATVNTLELLDNADLAANPVQENNLFLETKQLLQEGIDQLPPQTRKIYLLSREEGLKINEIAEKLDISPQTVKNTLGRSIKALRDHLEDRGIYLPLFLLGRWFL